MSRSGYTEDVEDDWELVLWRGAVASAIRGKRGQSFLKEMLIALDAMTGTRIRLDEFAKVRVFFWISVTLFGTIDFGWQCTTDAPFLFRISNGLITGVIVFLVFPKVMRWLRAREAKAGTPR